MADDYEKALKDVEARIELKRQVFRSNEYAVGQPMSSFSERFALECILKEIDHLRYIRKGQQ